MFRASWNDLGFSLILFNIYFQSPIVAITPFKECEASSSIFPTMHMHETNMPTSGTQTQSTTVVALIVGTMSGIFLLILFALLGIICKFYYKKRKQHLKISGLVTLTIVFHTNVTFLFYWTEI